MVQVTPPNPTHPPPPPNKNHQIVWVHNSYAAVQYGQHCNRELEEGSDLESNRTLSCTLLTVHIIIMMGPSYVMIVLLSSVIVYTGAGESGKSTIVKQMK